MNPLRLGNNDVPEKLAQKASCLAPKDFRSVVTIVRAALADTLRPRNSTRRATFEAICQENFLMNDDALYWMERAEKELLKTGKLDELDVRHEAVRCAVYRFVCKLLGVRSFFFFFLCCNPLSHSLRSAPVCGSTAAHF